MVIDLPGLTGSQTNVTRSRAAGNQESGSSTAPSASPASPKGDTVQLSDTALKMKNAQERLASTPDVDLDKIASIKAQLESGEYTVDARATAQGMISFEEQLG